MLTGDQKEIAGQIAQQLVNKIQQPFTVLPQLSPYALQKYRTSINRMTNVLSMRNGICDVDLT